MIEIFVILFVVGVMAGTMGSLVGLGGGVVIVPALIYTGIFTSFDVSPQVAVGTSLLVMIFTALSSSLSYMKQKKVDFESAALFFLASGPGAVFGAYVNQFLGIDQFNVYFGLFIIFISFLLMVRGKLRKREQVTWTVTKTYTDPHTQEKVEYGYQRGTALLISFFVGMLSGLFGIGGGALMVPAMLMLFHFPPSIAIATSMFIILLSSSLGSVIHFLYGNINWLFVLALAPGAWLGGRLGAFISSRLKAETLIITLRIVLILVGVRLMWQGYTGI